MAQKDSFEPLKRAVFAEALVQLDELLSRDNIAFLFGAGTSYCESMPLMSTLTDSVLQAEGIDESTKKILSAVKELFGKGRSNIEDFLSEIGDHLAIAERRELRSGSSVQTDIGGHKYSTEQLRQALAVIKSEIAQQISSCPVPNKLAHHRRFISALHRPVRPGRRLGRSFDYLVLNYDTFVEDALALEKVIYADGLEGGPNGWWHPESTFSRRDVSARVLKLHGSIDWRQVDDDPLPRRIAEQSFDTKDGQVLIWPASTKYAEAQKDPFAQLLTRARGILNPRESESRLLVICGYSFGDAHINGEIEAALSQSDGRLTVVVFTGDDSLPAPVEEWRKYSEISSNVLVFGKSGFWHGSTEETSTDPLPWWKFENVARIVEGER